MRLPADSSVKPAVPIWLTRRSTLYLWNCCCKLVNALVKLLYLDKAEQVGVIDLGKWFPAIFGKVFDLKVLSEGDVLYVKPVRTEGECCSVQG